MIIATLIALLIQSAAPAPAPPYAMSGEDSVDPYAVTDANAGAKPFAGTRLFDAFHGQPGIDRIVDELVATSQADSRISDIFKGQDMVRLRRTLKEQFCYLLGGNCHYSGRDMAASHKDLGIQAKDMNALVENLQHAMTREGVPFARQNEFLSKLAPMKKDVVTR